MWASLVPVCRSCAGGSRKAGAVWRSNISQNYLKKEKYFPKSIDEKGKKFYY